MGTCWPVVPMTVTITTDDFNNVVLAREQGYYRKHYFCPVCNLEIGCQTFAEDYMFGQGTVLHSNKFPNFCPDCGTRLALKDLNL